MRIKEKVIVEGNTIDNHSNFNKIKRLKILTFVLFILLICLFWGLLLIVLY